MVLVLDGNSEICAHVYTEISYEVCLRYQSLRIFFFYFHVHGENRITV